MFSATSQSPEAVRGGHHASIIGIPNDLSTSPNNQFVSPGAVSHDSTFTHDDYFNSSRYQELQTELRDLLFTGVQTAEASYGESTSGVAGDRPQSSRDFAHDSGQLNLYDQLRSISPHISMQAKLDYLHNWMDECAPWLDMFDQSRHFGLQVTVLAQRSPAVLSALLAVAARQRERRRGLKGASLDSLEFYSQAINSLTTRLKVHEPEVLTTACLLCVLEMLSANPRDWRRHLDGCAALFQTTGVNGFSGGLMQAVFWCYARMDLIEAMIAEQTESTVLPIDKWVILPATSSPMSISRTLNSATTTISETFLQQGRLVPDMHANYAVYLSGKVCDLLTRRTRYLEMGDNNGCNERQFDLEWTLHWNELQLWFDQRPPQLIAAQTPETPDPNQQQQFPHIFFSHWAAISSNQLCHTSCILLLNSKPSTKVLVPSTLKNPRHTSKLWHARQVVGISATNPHPGCLNNAIQPLYIAGRLFTHRDEQRVVVRLLDHIEAASGWGSRWRIADLEVEWGYARGTFRKN